MKLPDPPQSFAEFKAEQDVRDKAFALEMKAYRRRFHRRFWLRVGGPSVLVCALVGVVGLLVGVPGVLIPLSQWGAAYVTTQVAKRRLDRQDALAARSES